MQESGNPVPPAIKRREQIRRRQYPHPNDVSTSAEDSLRIPHSCSIQRLLTATLPSTRAHSPALLESAASDPTWKAKLILPRWDVDPARNSILLLLVSFLVLFLFGEVKHRLELTSPASEQTGCGRGGVGWCVG